MKDARISLGSTISTYELISVLGQGGHATVFHGHDASAGRHVAIKVIRSPKKELQRRGGAEGQFLVSLRHPNIVQVFEVGTCADGCVYIVMEKLDGRSLREIKVRLHRLSVPEALGVGVQMASGVLAAHAARVIHRDLKPDNIFLLPDGTIKVLDFGIAKYLDQSFDTTGKMRWQGTPAYMSPEQLQGIRATFQSDVFALGVILYELIAGFRPHEGEEQVKSFEQFAVRHLMTTPKALHELDPNVPERASRIIHKALAKAPAARLSMSELKTCMEQELAVLGGSGRPPRDLVRACADTTDPDFVPAFTALSQRATPHVAAVRTDQQTVEGGFAMDHGTMFHPRPSVTNHERTLHLSREAAPTHTAPTRVHLSGGAQKERTAPRPFIRPAAPLRRFSVSRLLREPVVGIGFLAICTGGLLSVATSRLVYPRNQEDVVTKPRAGRLPPRAEVRAIASSSTVAPDPPPAALGTASAFDDKRRRPRADNSATIEAKAPRGAHSAGTLRPSRAVAKRSPPPQAIASDTSMPPVVPMAPLEEEAPPQKARARASAR